MSIVPLFCEISELEGRDTRHDQAHDQEYGSHRYRGDKPFVPAGDLPDAEGYTTVTRVDETLAPTPDPSDRRRVTVKISWRMPGRDERLSTETTTLIVRQ